MRSAFLPMVPTPAQEVILEAVRADGPRADRLRELLRREPDWTALRETALRHGVLPLVYFHLKEAAGEAAPPGEAERMKALYNAAARRSFLMTADLLRVLKLLASRGIAAVPVKGPSLAEAVYGDGALRTFDDLDILVRREDIPAVCDLLTAGGYRPLHVFTKRQEKVHLRRTCELTFLAPGGEFSLDVHWRFAADYLAAAWDPGDVFARLEKGSLQGHAVPALPGDDLLLFLCLHGTFHLWTRLVWIGDVARLVGSRGDWDWTGLLRKAGAVGLRRSTLLGLALARDVTGVELPPEVVAAVEGDGTLAVLREHVRAALFRREEAAPGFAETALFQLRAKERLADKVRYGLIRSLVPTLFDWEAVSLPDPLYFLYYLIRPLRLAGLSGALARFYPSGRPGGEDRAVAQGAEVSRPAGSPAGIAGGGTGR